MAVHDLGPWQPLAVRDLALLLAGAYFPWWVAGGWAIDRFVGHQTRQHDDLDVLVLRRDQLVVQHALRGWDLHAADPPGTLRPWAAGEALGAGIYDIWCRPDTAAPWALQLMLADIDRTGTHWIFRRDPRVTGSLSRLGSRSAEGIPYVAPEVQLLYKAKQTPLPKDEADFAVALPLLDVPSRRWLTEVLTTLRQQHPWLAPLVLE